MRALYLILLCPFIAAAQINPVYVYKSDLAYSKLEASGDGMFGFEKSGKFGYMDKNQKVVIPADYAYENTTYKTIPSFSQGYVKIKKDGKYGLLDKTGKIVLPFEYESINTGSVMKNYATAGKKVDGNTRYGVVNMQNKAIIPFEYDNIQADSNLVAVKQPGGNWGLLDISGRKLLSFEYPSLTVYAKEKMLKAEKDGKIIFMNITGKPLFEKVKNVYTIYGIVEGMILCSVNSKYGYLDLKGNEAIITKFDNANNFESVGLAKVGRSASGSSYTYKYGYIDKKGNEVIPVKYDYMGIFSNGLVYAKDPETNRYGYLDKTGKWAIQPTFLEAQTFDASGGAWVKMTDNKYHYINKAGKDYGSFAETSYKVFLNDGYAIFENADNPYVLMDKTGKTIQKIDNCDGIYAFSEGFAGYKCKSNGQYGFIDYKGNKMLTCELTGFTGFDDGVSKVSKTVDGKTKSGYADTKGNYILPVEYDNLYNFRDGWGLVKKDDGYFFVDKSGNLKEPPRKYDELYEFRSGFAVGLVKGTPNTYYYINTDLKEAFSIEAKEAYLFWENVAVVKRDADYELMNKKGEVFKTLSDVSTLKFCVDGMLVVKGKENGKWGFIDDKGTVIVPPKYDSCESFKYGYGRFKQNGKWGIIDKTGKEVVEAKYENILSGENGIFIFYDSGWGAMDKTGKILIPSNLYTVTPFEKDRALARLGKTYTILKSPLAK